MEVKLRGGFYTAINGGQKHLVNDRAAATVLLVTARASADPGIRVKTKGVRADDANATDVEFETEIAVESIVA